MALSCTCTSQASNVNMRKNLSVKGSINAGKTIVSPPYSSFAVFAFCIYIFPRDWRTVNQLRTLFCQCAFAVFLAGSFLGLLFCLAVFIGLLIGGPLHDPFYGLFGLKKSKSLVRGYVAPGYENALEVFTKIIESGYEECAQACAYVDGELVVDLYGIGLCRTSGDTTENGASSPRSPRSPRSTKSSSGTYTTYSALDGSPYDWDTVQNVFSSSKVVTSLVIAMLVDRGLLSYSTRVCDVWPAFAAEGKEDITIEDVCKHEAGLYKFKEIFTLEDLQRDALKKSLLARGCATSTPVSTAIAKAKPAVFPSRPSPLTNNKHLPVSYWPEADKENEIASDSAPKSRSYHSLTRGWILNEVVMRVDPQHRTVGEFVRDEIARPLGLSKHLTMGPETLEAKSIKNLTPVPARWLWAQLFKQWDRTHVTSRHIVIHLLITYSFQLTSFVNKYIWDIRNYIRPTFAPDQTGDYINVIELFNRQDTRSAEIPSANIHANARALAKVANALILRAKDVPPNPKHPELLSQETILHTSTHPTKNLDTIFSEPTLFTRGGWAVMSYGVGCPRQHSLGWIGVGGSACQWHNETGTAFGYACSFFGPNLFNKNSADLQNTIIDCARAIKEERKRVAAEKLQAGEAAVF